MNAEARTPPQEIDKRFLIAVGGLLIVIILLLAGLWLRMRRKVIRLQTDIALLQQRLPRAKTDHEKAALRRQIAATDRQIDQLVYELYGLTDEEIRIVEEADEGKRS